MTLYLKIAAGAVAFLIPFLFVLRLLLKARMEDKGYGNAEDMSDIGPTTGL